MIQDPPLAAQTTSSSLVAGRVDELMVATIGEALGLTVERAPDAMALISAHQGVRWSWAQLHREVEAFAAGLLGMGLTPGERIAIRATNCAEWTVVQLAAAKAGLILVSLHSGCRQAEILHAVKQVGVVAIIGGRGDERAEFIRLMEAIAPEIPASEPGMLQAAEASTLKWVILLDGEPRPGWTLYDDIRRSSGGANLHAATPGPGSPVSIQFTSGTTGVSKAATLTHVGLLNNARSVAGMIGLSDRDLICIPVPLHHCFGLVLGNLAAVVTGAAMVYPSARFDPIAVLRAIEAERCTCLYGVPTMFLSILDHPRHRRFDTRTLRTGIIAGAPCPPDLFHRAVEEIGIPELTIAYGMTETSPVSFQTPPDDPASLRGQTVGEVLPNIKAKVVDGAGAVVPRGVIGEVCVSGYLVMPGYWRDEAATARAVDDEGWMHTGDLAFLGDDDRLRIVGRVHDMVIRGGENIYPREIELAMLSCPGVANVTVAGVPDEIYGQELCAWVQVKPGSHITPADVTLHCRAHIADYKIPRYINFIEHFPLTESGKVKTGELKQAFEQDRARRSAAK